MRRTVPDRERITIPEPVAPQHTRAQRKSPRHLVRCTEQQHRDEVPADLSEYLENV